ncbi:MOSC domain-containing protein [Intrasporangium calvum]|uniref:MOSC domain containing protein n=1 Tax=Intrasporangium calvum (strain ATCC 23552 / DSM 43043 / JCM 3097 / NBRC 12989 / NCIMB 10167 / NRRL B-3866 / 7 KIP) TaxID=710696 RepID=E6SFU8_INTC7|nr:MOSC domain-containing protein [Intrasporangium calvum]ADU48877.1 MOSC domain containing protein [Intrasporangium calvum DSM 43043]
MKPPHVMSVNLGKGVPRPYASGPTTAIDKGPVPEGTLVEIRDPGSKRGGLGSGLVGDDIGDRRHHGGAQQAVYAYAREDQQWWEEQLGRALPPGSFGENLTTLGVDTTHALIGEVWRLGEVVLRVEVPRIPCATFAGHLGVRGWVRRFGDAGRTGAYLSVVTPGVIEPGVTVEVERPDHDIDLLLSFRAALGDLEAATRVLEARVLHPDEQVWLADKVARRRR